MKTPTVFRIVTITSILILVAGTYTAALAKRVPAENKSRIELVFVLDTTGSMSGLIEAAKDKIWSIASTMATAEPTPEIRIGIVGYRDRGDTYVTTITHMTDDLDKVYRELMAFGAQGGGDTPESVNQALYDAVHKPEWSSSTAKVYKVIFLVGDAPPHLDYQDDVHYRKTCKAASQKGIIINTIQCGNIGGTKPIWQEIASLSDGDYFRVSQGGDSTDYKTPFDRIIAEKSKELHETKVYYGDREFHQKNQAKLDAVKDIYSEAKVSAVAKRSSFNLSKAGKKNFLGSQELVDAVTTGSRSLESIPENELPKEMQTMSKTERKAYIKKKQEKREAISKELKTLADKRQAYIREQVAKEKDKGKNSFDMKIYKCIRQQAEAKAIEYKEDLKY